ncbi:unnamed protein product [Sphenostylis stenocarpa]|uniref:Uncharacterized protein n=1 Tax=Sphenostylis stenocarpa TaxID=92480 RepID=A0AA86W3U0_9FABA|nr:unnamed protein product [Sphenostylis stenocarpa]
MAEWLKALIVSWVQIPFLSARKWNGRAKLRERKNLLVCVGGVPRRIEKHYLVSGEPVGRCFDRPIFFYKQALSGSPWAASVLEHVGRGD